VVEFKDIGAKPYSVPPAKGELFLRIAGDKDKITGGHGKLEVTIAEIPYFDGRQVRRLMLNASIAVAGTVRPAARRLHIYERRTAHKTCERCKDLFAHTAEWRRGVAEWWQSCRRLNSIGPLLKKKLTLKSKHADESITEEVFGEKLTVRVAGSHASFTIEP